MSIVHDKQAGRFDLVYLLPFFLMLIAVTTSVAKVPTARDWHGIPPGFEDAYRAPIFGGIYALAFVLALTRAGTLLGYGRRTIGYLLFLGYVALSAIWSQYPLGVLIFWGHSLGTFLTCLLCVEGLNGRDERLARLLLLFAVLAISASLIVSALHPQRGVMLVGGKLRWMGLTSHPNSLGAMALIAVWTASFFIFCNRGERWYLKWLALPVAAAAGVCLIKANSITSLVLALTTGTIPFVLMLVSARGLSSRIFRGALIAFLGATVVLCVYLARPELFSIEGLFRAMGRTRYFSGRAELWTKAVNAIGERPLLGWSFDSFHSLNTKYRIGYGQFHNGYLDLLIRGGFIGMALVAGILFSTFRNLLRIGRARPRVFAGLIVLFLILCGHNFTEASLGRPPHLIWLMLTFLYVYTSAIRSVPATAASDSGDGR